MITFPRSALTLAAAAMMLAGSLTAAVAQEAQNPAVKARMEAMRTIGQNNKLIADMVQGKTAFDAAAAEAAVRVIAQGAKQIPVLFEAEEADPVSEAKPEIWQDWDDFVARSAALENAAQGVDPSSPDALKAALPALGGSCRACHDAYRL